MAEGQEKWLLDLVGIATLSDMVPLVNENRMLAHFGLRVLRRNRRAGLSSLLSLLRINPKTLTEDDIGFMVAPRINAASRMDKPSTAARLLSSENAEEAGECLVPAPDGAGEGLAFGGQGQAPILLVVEIALGVEAVQEDAERGGERGSCARANGAPERRRAGDGGDLRIYFAVYSGL